MKLEQDLKEFKELKELHSVDEVNELLANGWVLLEASINNGKKIFLLGKKIQEKTEKEFEKKLNEPVKEKNQNIEKLKSLVFGPIFLALGLWLFFEVSPKKISVFGIETSFFENLVLFVSVILVIAGLVNVFYAVARNEEVVK